MTQNEKQWIEISLEVDQELAEAVASALGEILPGGVVLERASLDVFPDQLNQLVGPVRVFGYLPVDGLLEERKNQINRALYFLGRISPLPAANYRPIQNKDWTEAWKVHYQPIPLGSELIIVPSWLKNPDPDRQAVLMDPGMAFGSGTHPSTQLCLILIEEYLDENRVRHMLDLGTGSGILAIAAVKLGVPFVLGVDIDQKAVEIAKKNSDLNQTSARTRFSVGSVQSFLAGEIQPEKAELVAANMIAPYLEKLVSEGLVELVISGGSLVLSGILESQVSPLMHQLLDYELKIEVRRQLGEWVALRLTKPY
jgi:ribosomal protein L11 methyltransferase